MGWMLRRCMRGAMHLFSCLVIPYSRIKNRSIPRTKLPPITNELLLIPANKLAHMIRTQQVKCVDVIQAYIDRCEEVNPFINAIVENRFEEALAEAKKIDSDIANGLRTIEEMETELPLLGLPITVKESIAVAGMSNQGGRRFKKKKIAKEDADIVRMARQKGAIVLLVSNTPELCMNWETYNFITGQTRNPYDLTRTSGGSSGGEAALLGAGASLLGLTSDVAGSARLPAMWCGVFGHKPTPHAVSPAGHCPGSDAPNWGDFFTTAPMCRYAKDLPLLLQNVRDPKGPELTLLRTVDLKGINFFFMPNDGPSGLCQPIESEMKAAIERVCQHFEAKRVNLNLMKWSLDISSSAMLRIENVESIYFPNVDGEEAKTPTSEFFKYICGFSDFTFSSVMYAPLQGFIRECVPNSRKKQLEDIAERLKEEFQDMLKDNGVFIYPSFPTVAHHHYEIFRKLVEPSYLMVFNTLGMPVTNCMIGLNKDGMPMGLQVVANPGQDHLSLAVAEEIEKVFGGWQKP